MPAGQVVSRITNDTKAVRILYQVVLAQFMLAGIYALGIYISLALIDPFLILIALTSIPIMYFVFEISREISPIQPIYRSKLSELNGNLNENIQAMEVISSLGKEKQIYRSLVSFPIRYMNSLGM